MKNKKRIWISLGGLFIFAAMVLASANTVQLDVLSQQLQEVTVKTGGEDDYALKYTVRVRNKGKAGKVRVAGRIRTTEGQFYRDKIVQLDPQEEMTLEFIFTEPTVWGQIVGGANGESKIKYEFSYESVP